jgi:hypothetical protein
VTTKLSRYRPALDRLEDRLVPSTFYWNGTQNANWNQASNWTDVANSANHAVPGATDTAIIQSSKNDPNFIQSQTVGGLEVDGGTLTIKNSTLTDAGAFVQTGGTVQFTATNDSLHIRGDVTRTGGDFGTHAVGTVFLDGTTAQNFAGRIINPACRMPATVISNPAGVVLLGGLPGEGIADFYGTDLTVAKGSKLTLQQGASASFLWLSGNFYLNGTLDLTQLSPNGADATSLVNLTSKAAGKGVFALGASAVIDLHVSPAVAGASYYFARYQSWTGTAIFNVTGNGGYAATPGFGPDGLTVALAQTATLT